MIPLILRQKYPKYYAINYNKILDNFYEVEVDDGDEVPDEIEWYYADHDERVYYDYDNRSLDFHFP